MFFVLPGFALRNIYLQRLESSHQGYRGQMYFIPVFGGSKDQSEPKCLFSLPFSTYLHFEYIQNWYDVLIYVRSFFLAPLPGIYLVSDLKNSERIACQLSLCFLMLGKGRSRLYVCFSAFGFISTLWIYSKSIRCAHMGVLSVLLCSYLSILVSDIFNWNQYNIIQWYAVSVLLAFEYSRNVDRAWCFSVVEYISSLNIFISQLY